jgi:D-3-phosphoglycerate dehydrogenase
MSKITINSVLIADEIEQECIDCLKAAHLQVVQKTKLSEPNLIAELKQFDAVVVRSATKVSAWMDGKPIKYPLVCYKNPI